MTTPVCCALQSGRRGLTTTLNTSFKARTFSSHGPVSSHIGSLPIRCPPSVQLLPHNDKDSTVRDFALARSTPSFLRVVGPKGEIPVELQPFVRLSTVGTAAPAEGVAWTVEVENPSVKHQRAIWGLTRSLVANAIEGVSNGYTLSLRLVGVGYRAAVEDSPSAAMRLNLKLGFAHPVVIDLPPDVQASTPTTTTIVLSGIDKQRLGQVAARIRSWRVPEPYNVSTTSGNTVFAVVGLSLTHAHFVPTSFSI